MIIVDKFFMVSAGKNGYKTKIVCKRKNDVLPIKLKGGHDPEYGSNPATNR